MAMTEAGGGYTPISADLRIQLRRWLPVSGAAVVTA